MKKAIYEFKKDEIIDEIDELMFSEFHSLVKKINNDDMDSRVKVKENFRVTIENFRAKKGKPNGQNKKSVR